MTSAQIATAVAIHLGVPLLGVAVFLALCSRMRRAAIPAPPFVAWFILFFTVGGWLLVALTALFWEWSGMASLGVFFLVLVAPWLTAASAWELRGSRAVSAFHRWAFFGSAGYSGLMLLLVLVWLGFLVRRPHS
jgi:hypothetical protein